MKRIIRILLSYLPIVAGVLLFTELVLTNELAGLGERLQESMQATQEAKVTHETLIAQVATVTSLAALESRAQALGFHEPTKGQILSLGTSELPVALLSHEP